MNASHHLTWFLNLGFPGAPEVGCKVEPGKPRDQSFSGKAGIDTASFLRSRANPPIERRPVILFPTNLSEDSLAAASFILSVAQQLAGRLVIVHGLRLNLMDHGPANVARLTKELREEAELKCESLLELAREANVPATIIITQDISTTDAVLEQVKKWDADLVMLAECPCRWPFRWLHRRHDNRIMRQAKCPVMVLQADR